MVGSTDAGLGDALLLVVVFEVGVWGVLALVWVWVLLVLLLVVVVVVVGKVKP